MMNRERKFIASILICVSVFLTAPQQAHAIPVAIVKDPWTVIQTTVNMVGNVYSAITAFAMGSLVTKEYVLDSVAYTIIQAAREALVRSVIDWVNNGFEGSPAFVQNLQGYLLNVGDEIASEFITGSGLDALCSPFALNVKGALSLDYAKNTRHGGERINKCSFTDITKNIANFGKSVENSFTTEDFFAYTSNPVNTPQGAYLDAKASLGVSITNKKGEEVKLLDFGSGFLSKKECSDVDGTEVCSMVTPGDTISASLNKSLGLGADSLVTADEMNELVGAFIGYLLRTSLNSLAGANNSGSSGNIGFSQDLPTFDQTETRNALDRVMGPQQSAIRSFESILAMMAAQCVAPDEEEETSTLGVRRPEISAHEAQMEEYRRRGVYEIYLDVTGRISRANEKLREMQTLRTATMTNASTEEAIALTGQITALIESADVYMNSIEVDDIITSYRNTINARCPAGLFRGN